MPPNLNPATPETQGNQSTKTREGSEENDLQGLSSHVYSIWNVCWGEKNHTRTGISSLHIFQGSAMKTFSWAKREALQLCGWDGGKSFGLEERGAHPFVPALSKLLAVQLF